MNNIVIVTTNEKVIVCPTANDVVALISFIDCSYDEHDPLYDCYIESSYKEEELYDFMNEEDVIFDYTYTIENGLVEVSK